jgi:glycogen(starch) synthase
MRRGLPLKIFAALGPGDIVEAHRQQIAHQSVETETSIIYSGQFLEFCRLREVKVLAISHNARIDLLVDADIQLENNPTFMRYNGALTFHLSRILRAFYLAYRAKRFGADYALINSGSTHYFALSVFSLLGIRVAVDFHNTLWPTGYPPRGVLKTALRKLDGLYFRWCSAGTIGVSEECGRQVRELAKRVIPFFGYKCQFRAADFSNSALRSPMEDGVFRLAFVGRVEANKGTLDLVAIADLLRTQPVKFEVCGDGPALIELKKQVQDKKLDEAFTIRGALGRQDLLNVYKNSDAVIVPTRSDFAEGMPKVCAEAALFGLPILTSKLSNALDTLGPAIVETQPDRPESYAAAILTLVRDPQRCINIRASCSELTAPFLDRNNGLASAFDRLLSVSSPGWKLSLDAHNSVFAKVI